MCDHDTLLFLKASEQRPLHCQECSECPTAAHAAETSGVMFCLQTVHVNDPLQLTETSFHHVTCLPLVTLHCATPTGSVERIDGYNTLSDDMKRALHVELSPLLHRAVDVMRDVQGDEFNRLPAYYIHQRRIAQLQCKQCHRMLLDAVELPCCPAYPLCSLCWQDLHLSSGVQVDMGGCDACGTLSALVTLVSCPSCKRAVEVAKVIEDSAMRVRVSEKLVRCPNEKHGCEAVVKAKEALEHIVHCPFEVAKRARVDEKQADTDSEQEEEGKGGCDWENVSAGSGTDSEVEIMEDPTSADDHAETRSSISFASPLVTLAVMAPPKDDVATESDMATAEQATTVQMIQEEHTDSEQAEEDASESNVTTEAHDTNPLVAPAAAGAHTESESQHVCDNSESMDEVTTFKMQQADDSVSSLAVNGTLIPLMLTDIFGSTMSPALLALRQQHSQSIEQQLQTAAEPERADGAVKRRADVEDTMEEPERKRIKTEIVVD